MLTSAVIKYETRTMHTGIITRPPISMMTSAAVVKKKKTYMVGPFVKKKKSKKTSSPKCHFAVHYLILVTLMHLGLDTYTTSKRYNYQLNQKHKELDRLVIST